jgi:streptogramin lyase
MIPTVPVMCRGLFSSRPGLLLGLLLGLAGCATAPQAQPHAKVYAFWPPYPDEPHIQFLTSYQRNTDVEPAKSPMEDLIYGREPQPVLAIQKPYGVAMWHGRVYVCDIGGSAVTILDLRQHRTEIMGTSGAEGLQTPSDIAIAADGTKYVADVSRGMVYVFDARDHQTGTLGHANLKPTGVAVYQNELYVCDFNSQKVEVWDRGTGRVLRTLGGPGTGPGQFLKPLGVAVDAQGNVYVMDVLACRLQKFDRRGQLVTRFGTMSAGIGGLVRPKHIAVDSEGIIYVVDAAFQNVQLFDQSGAIFTFFGTAGGHPGAMYLPAGICLDDEDLDLFRSFVHPAFQVQHLLVVTNQFGDNKVAIYAVGHLRPGKTVADIADTKGVVPLGVTGPDKTAGVPTTLPAEAPGTPTPAGATSARP